MEFDFFSIFFGVAMVSMLVANVVEARRHAGHGAICKGCQ